MLRALAACVVVSLLSAAASAQVIYQPVRYQFPTGYGDQHYLYGGADPRVHELANSGCPLYGYANNLHRFDGGNSFGQPSPMYDRTPVFTDCIPYQDASRFGYSEADARNEAYGNAARYFRKADQLIAAQRTLDGAVIVPPTPVYVVPAPHYRAPTTMPGRGQIIIIPKRLLDRPLKDFTAPPMKVAAAQ